MLKLSSDLLPALKGEAWVSEMSKQSFGFWACNFQLFQSSFLSLPPQIFHSFQLHGELLV
jgi:hypothetical protein